MTLVTSYMERIHHYCDLNPESALNMIQPIKKLPEKKIRQMEKRVQNTLIA